MEDWDTDVGISQRKVQFKKLSGIEAKAGILSSCCQNWVNDKIFKDVGQGKQMHLCEQKQAK